VVAATGSKFGLPEVDNGALGAATHLGRLVPEKHVRWLLSTCGPVTAEQLLAWGAVLTVVIRAAKRSLNEIDDDLSRKYRLEQGITFELNLSGLGRQAR